MPMTQAPDESQMAAAAGAAAAAAAAAAPEEGAVLRGAAVHIDAESYTQDEATDLATELWSNGAQVVASLDGTGLSQCTHVLCECDRTAAFARVANQVNPRPPLVLPPQTVFPPRGLGISR